MSILDDQNNINEIASGISPIEEIIEDARAGRMFILVDAETRENEGDLIIPASVANAESINFMAKYGRGLICLALNAERATDLNLDFMVRHNQARNQTAFTVSIEAREGITTGISAHDRAHTIAVAIDKSTKPNDIVSPGHVFPLVARDGGVLVRAGHTEAAVDIARLGGQAPAGVICEIMNDDGTMARLPDLIRFAKEHGLKIGTIADLIAYRHQHDRLIYQSAEEKITSPYGGEFTCRIYRSKLDDVEHIALIKGEVNPEKPTLVRMHGCNIMRDILGLTNDLSGAETVQKSMKIIGEQQSGVIVLVRHGEANVLSSKLTQPEPEAKSGENRLIEFGIGAEILSDIGVKQITLLSNSKPPKIVGLESFNLEIIGHQPIE